MKHRKHVAWSYHELPEWVSQGIVPAPIADRIRSHYGELGDEAGGPRRWTLVVFGLLGPG
ncbi:MAG: hypothetical protein N3A53_07690 [Verrucomicrobiae bacterium]|nr:hypothetical protein [Verrucomicrobiae bacterium]MCX7916167.1 hypothetical protein [Verrucomicrobiae bacterium]